jgi:hypothetical protein
MVLVGGEDDVFEMDRSAPAEAAPATNAIAWLREELDMPKGQNMIVL